MKHLAWLTLMSAAVAMGCGGEAPDAQTAASTESDVRATYNGDLSLLGSYNELFDTSADTACVKYEDAEVYSRVAEPSRDLSIELVRNKQELAQKLDIDLKMQARYATVGGNAAVDLLHDFSSSTNAVSYLLSARADYLVRDDVRDGRSIILTDAGEEALAEGPASFTRRCGTHYLHGVRYGARFYLLITYSALSHRSKTRMDATLGLDGGGIGSGDIQSRLENTASLDGVNVTIHAASNGFWLDAEPAQAVVKAMESLTVDADLFSASTKLYFAMVGAVEQDYCLDAGQGNCEGEASPGYFARTRRDTSVTGIQLGAYHTLQNATWSTPENPFAVIKERVEVHERFIRNWSELEVRMDSIYSDEIRPFMQAPSKYKPLFNIAPPGNPLRTPEEVYAVAKELDELIFPPTGGVMGWLREDIHDRIVSCAGKVNVDITASCTADDTPIDGAEAGAELEADQTEAWNDLYGFFETYHQTKRILPIHVAVGTTAVSYDSAQDHCDDLAEALNGELGAIGSSNSVVYRPALGDEVKVIAPVLSHGNISWNAADLPHATWYTPVGNAQPCGDDHPYYVNQPANGTASYGCAENGWVFDEALVPVCVPASGPVPLLAPK
jgi:hypothetical protein